jgi:aldehyde:ferredoxin oxidoreductase
LGPLIGNSDMDLVMAASRRCDELGLDTISMGGTIAFARECLERDLLHMPELSGPPDAFLLPAIEATASRSGYGAELALGSRALARRIGKGSEAFAPHVKGMELPGYHPGALQTLGLGFAVGSRGADHNKSSAYDLDLSGTVDRFVLDATRIEAMIELEDQAVLMDSLILCKFVRRAVRELYSDSAEMMRALTGWDLDPEELRATARTIHHLKKLFNQRQGWDQSEDTLPQRFFARPDSDAAALAAGSSKVLHSIDPHQFLKARSRYYELRGWNAEGAIDDHSSLLVSLDLSPDSVPPA